MATVYEKMKALADEIRDLSGSPSNDLKGIDEMTSDVNAANHEIDDQMSLIAQIIAALESKFTETERLEGDGQEFHTMAPSTLTFRSTAPLNELQDVQINGQTVDPSNYELEEGSTIVKLKHDYLSTLGTGKYELSVVSDSKTVKGDFTVAALELNEYGFYYNAPYYVYVGNGGGVIGFQSVVIFSPDHTVNIYQIDSSNVYTGSYTYENGTMSFNLTNDQTSNVSPFSGSFSNGGKELTGTVDLTDPWVLGSGTEDITLTIDIGKAAADNFYVYYDYNGIIAYFPISRALADYPTAKSNILDKPVQEIPYEAFFNFANMKSVQIPDSVTTIASCAFGACTSLTSITLPASLTALFSAFQGCTKLESITFKGTTAQWNSINKDDDWNTGIPATYVQCSDGQVAI